MECDSVDAVILRFVIDFFNTGMMKIVMVQEEGEELPYFWVHYDTIVREVPIVRIKKQALRDRLDRYVAQGLMMKRVIKDRYGTFTYFRFVKERYEKLVRDCEGRATGSPLPAPTSSPLPEATGTPLPPKDSSTTGYTSTKEIYSLFSVWSARSELFSHRKESMVKNVKKRHEEIIEDIGIEKAIKAVNNYADILASRDHYFTYKWTFWDFIARGIYKFLDEAHPFISFSNKKDQKVDSDKEKFLKELRNGREGD